MVIRTLRLTNYRRFDSLGVSFSRKMNVLSGINGAGKSSILSAIATLLTWYIRRMVSPKATGNGTPISEREIRVGSTESEIGIVINDGESNLAWSLVKSVRGGIISSDKSSLVQLTEYVRKVREQEAIWSLPVLVEYTVNRAVLDIPLRIRTHHEFKLFNTYDDAFTGRVSFRSFFEWFRECEDIVNERTIERLKSSDWAELKEDFEQENALKVVKRALTAFLPEFGNWRVRRSPLRMEVTKGNTTLNVEQLSDGEKNLIAMVGDLARRLSIANRGSIDALNGNGIVLIDEIELHLHPAWQSNVLMSLMKTFPNVQFIITTHSPLVLSSLNVCLYRQHLECPGRDVNVFAVRDGKVESMLDQETGLIGAGEMDDAVRVVETAFDRLLMEHNGEV